MNIYCNFCSTVCMVSVTGHHCKPHSMVHRRIFYVCDSHLGLVMTKKLQIAAASEHEYCSGKVRRCHLVLGA
jgi:hypothetical protein